MEAFIIILMAIFLYLFYLRDHQENAFLISMTTGSMTMEKMMTMMIGGMTTLTMIMGMTTITLMTGEPLLGEIK